MRIRALLIGSLIFFAGVSCKNEPYEINTLDVISLVNHGTNTTLTFRYHDKKLYTFLSRTPTDTLENMKFNFQQEILKSIVSDSTPASKKMTTFYNSGTPTVTDSTFLIEADTTIKVSARVVTYDSDGNPISVDLTTWTDKGVTEELAELTWEDGNVVRLVTSILTTGEKVLSQDLAITHDDGNCVYTKKTEYLYTLPLTDLYWLSKNNPVTFNVGTGDKKYIYWYNKFGYPSNFQSDAGIIYGVTYTDVR